MLDARSNNVWGGGWRGLPYYLFAKNGMVLSATFLVVYHLNCVLLCEEEVVSCEPQHPNAGFGECAGNG